VRVDAISLKVGERLSALRAVCTWPLPYYTPCLNSSLSLNSEGEYTRPEVAQGPALPIKSVMVHDGMRACADADPEDRISVVGVPSSVASEELFSSTPGAGATKSAAEPSFKTVFFLKPDAP